MLSVLGGGIWIEDEPPKPPRQLDAASADPLGSAFSVSSIERGEKLEAPVAQLDRAPVS
jgi:hypothetical protein